MCPPVRSRTSCITPRPCRSRSASARRIWNQCGCSGGGSGRARDIAPPTYIPAGIDLGTETVGRLERFTRSPAFCQIGRSDVRDPAVASSATDTRDLSWAIIGERMVPKRSDIYRRLVLSLVLAAPIFVSAQQTARPPAVAASGDMIDRIFGRREFSPRPAPQPQWFDGGASYLLVEPAGRGSSQMSVVRYDSATGAKRDVLITPAQLTPAGAAAPLDIEELSWSNDGQRVLVFTNTRRVWRTNSRGDYWILDRRSGQLKKLGGNVPDASLMYAKFSPDATKVAYVRQNDIYVEDLAGGSIKRLTHDGTDLVINGGSDWVNEEELDLHDCYAWSPDGTRIAFWQFDLHGVGDFP